MEKNLKEKAIKIQGKNYVLVSDRIIYFNEQYPKGCIITEVITNDLKISAIAKVYPEGLEGRYFTGHSQEVEGSSFINKTSAIENAETSAVGRALAMMGIGVIDSIASVDEINKANNRAIKYDKAPIEPEKRNPILKQFKVEGGKCPDCETGVFKKAVSGTIYCSNKCWLPENAHLRKVKEDVIDVDDDMPLPKDMFN